MGKHRLGLKELKTRTWILLGLILIAILMIWPVRLIGPAAPDLTGRLTHEPDAITYYYLTEGEYVSTVMRGDGSPLRDLALRLRFQNAKVQEDTQLHLYLMDGDGNIVVDSYLPVLPRQAGDVYVIPTDALLEADRDYQLVLALDQPAEVGVECVLGTTQPVIEQLTEQNATFREIATADRIFRTSMVLLLVLAAMGLILGESPATALGAFALVYLMSLYLADHAAESRMALKAVPAVAVAMVVVSALVLMLSCLRKHDGSTAADGRTVLNGRTGFHGGWNDMVLPALVLIFLGILYLCAMPKLMVPDEANHFYRTFQIAHGGFFSTMMDEASGAVGGVLPAALQAVKDPNAQIVWEETAPIPFSNTALYSPICYLPQVLAIRIAELFTLRVSVIFLAARIGGFLAALVLSVLALRELPVGKELMTVILCLPMTLQEMTGVTSDTLTNALAFLYFAMIVRHLVLHTRPKGRRLFLLVILGAAVSMCKLIYVVLVALSVLVMLRESSEDRKLRALNASGWKKVLLMAGIPALCCVVSNVLYGRYLVSQGDGIDSGAQILYVLSHPFLTLRMVLRSIYLYGIRWIRECTCDYLGTLNVRTWAGLIFVVLLLIVLSCAQLRREAQLQKDLQLPEEPLWTPLRQWFGAGVLFVGFALVCASMYTAWEAVGADAITGIQGRYFLPFLPLLCFCLAGIGQTGAAGKEAPAVNAGTGEKTRVIANLEKLTGVRPGVLLGLLFVSGIVMVDLARFLVVSM